MLDEERTLFGNVEVEVAVELAVELAAELEVEVELEVEFDLECERGANRRDLCGGRPIASGQGESRRGAGSVVGRSLATTFKIAAAKMNHLKMGRGGAMPVLPIRI